MSLGTTVPDPGQTAQTQYRYNTQAAQDQMRMNAPLGNVTNAYGQNKVLTDARGMPIGQVSTLSQPLQDLLSQRTGLGGMINTVQGNIASNLPTGGVNQNFGDTVSKAQQAAYNAQTGMLEPSFALQQKQLEGQLDARGLPIGSEARTDAENQLANQQNLARTQAANQSYGAGLQAQSQGFNQAVTNQGLPYLQLSSLSGVNPSSGLLGAAPGAANLPGASVSPANYTQDVYNSAALQNQQNAQLWSGLTGLGSLALAPVTGGTSLLGLGLGYGK